MISPENLQANIQRFQSFLLLDPTNSNLLVDLGDALHQSGQYEEALQAFTRAEQSAADPSVAVGRIASVQLSKHQFAEAAATLQRLIASGVRDGAIFHNLGIALFQQREFAAALKSFLAAEQSGLAIAANLKCLAYCYHHLGDLDSAIAACVRWKDGSGTAESVGFLSLLTYDSGDRPGAQALAELAVSLDADNVDALGVLGSLALDDQEMALAGPMFARIVAQHPDYGRAWLGHGLTLLNYRKNPEAILALAGAVERMPGHAGTVVALAWAKLVAEDFGGAEQVFREAIACDRNFAEAYGGLGAALAHLGRIDEAKQAIAIADKLDTANFGAVYAKAALLRLDGKSGLADRLIDRALRQSPEPGAKPLIESLSKLMAGRKGVSR